MSRNNRRQWPRHEKKIHIQFTSALKNGFTVSTVANFSRGGLCIVSAEPMPRGRRVLVRLNRDLAGLAQEVWTTVKWSVPASVGGYALGLEYEHPLTWTRYP